MKIKLLLTSNQVATQAGAHPQQVARLTDRGVIKPTAATESGLKLFEPNAVRIVLRARSASNAPSFKIQSRNDRESFLKRASELKMSSTK